MKFQKIYGKPFQSTQRKARQVLRALQEMIIFTISEVFQLLKMGLCLHSLSINGSKLILAIQPIEGGIECQLLTLKIKFVTLITITRYLFHKQINKRHNNSNLIQFNVLKIIVDRKLVVQENSNRKYSHSLQRLNNNKIYLNLIFKDKQIFRWRLYTLMNVIKFVEYK